MQQCFFKYLPLISCLFILKRETKIGFIVNCSFYLEIKYTSIAESVWCISKRCLFYKFNHGVALWYIKMTNLKQKHFCSKKTQLLAIELFLIYVQYIWKLVNEYG